MPNHQVRRTHRLRSSRGKKRQVATGASCSRGGLRVTCEIGECLCEQTGLYENSKLLGCQQQSSRNQYESDIVVSARRLKDGEGKGRTVRKVVDEISSSSGDDLFEVFFAIGVIAKNTVQSENKQQTGTTGLVVVSQCSSAIFHCGGDLNLFLSDRLYQPVQ